MKKVTAPAEPRLSYISSDIDGGAEYRFKIEIYQSFN